MLSSKCKICGTGIGDTGDGYSCFACGETICWDCWKKHYDNCTKEVKQDKVVRF
jgi:hypothetical protein